MDWMGGSDTYVELTTHKKGAAQVCAPLATPGVSIGFEDTDGQCIEPERVSCPKG